MSESVVLIIGEDGDWSADTVAAELKRRNVQHFCMDTADFPQRMSFTAEFNTRWTGRIETINGTLDLRQLSVASRCGLVVPRTLITADADQARRFARDIGELVIKPLAAPIIHEGGGHTAVYTRRVTNADLDDLAGIEKTAHLLQAWVPKSYEVRLTVIADFLFAVAILARSERAIVDWRTDYESLSYEVVACPERVAKAVKVFMEAMGLRYGAFDFVVTPDAQWFFLECNAAGQWGWLAEQCNLPIASAIADELIAVHTR